MGEFFHGWRRKVGCVTLLMALMAMGGWVRTHFITDVVSAPFGKTTLIKVYSFRSNLIFMRSPQAYHFEWRSYPSSDGMMFGWDDQTRTALNFGWGGGAVDENPNDPTRECDMWSCPLKLFGCEVYLRSAIKSGTARLGVVIPYWSIVFPLTLISLWLLLSKPRKSTSQKIQ